MAAVFFDFGLVPGFPFWQFGDFGTVLVEDGTPVEAPRGWSPASWSFCLPFALMLPGPKGFWNRKTE